MMGGGWPHGIPMSGLLHRSGGDEMGSGGLVKTISYIEDTGNERCRKFVLYVYVFVLYWR